MPRTAQSPLASDIAAALDWWREAGVDAVFADEPHGWLAEAAPTAPAGQASAPAKPPAEAPPAPSFGGARSGWPATLAEFAPWWLAEPSLDEGGLAPRIAPRGGHGAELMVLVPMPEAEDAAELLSGPQGALLDGFLAAAGLTAAQVYRASALPRHTPLPDWPALARQGLGAVLAHHVMLAAPRRLLVLGPNILPFCAHDPAQEGQIPRWFAHEGGRVPMLAEAGLERLLAKGPLRARLWQRWLDWTDGSSE